jgi:hypothetical protein
MTERGKPGMVVSDNGTELTERSTGAHPLRKARRHRHNFA